MKNNSSRHTGLTILTLPGPARETMVEDDSGDEMDEDIVILGDSDGRQRCSASGKEQSGIICSYLAQKTAEKHYVDGAFDSMSTIQVFSKIIFFYEIHRLVKI